MEKEYFGIKIDMDNPMHKKIVPEEIRDLEEKFGFTGLSEKYVELIATTTNNTIPEEVKNDSDFITSLFIGRFANFINIYYCLYKGVTETVERLDKEIEEIGDPDDVNVQVEIVVKRAQLKAIADVIETLDTLLDMELVDKMKNLGINLVPDNKTAESEEVKENV